MPEKSQKKKKSTPATKRPKRKKDGNFFTLGIAFLVLLSGIIYLSWEKPSEERKVEVNEKIKVKVKPEPVKPERPEKPKLEPEKREKPAVPIETIIKPPASSESKPKIAIIIDDIGNSQHLDSEIISIDATITLSVFPLLSDSKSVAEKAVSGGKEVMLHLPMEPYDYPQVDPGKGALFTSMDDISIITQLYEDINSVPGIKGVNNHMGSRFTADREKMLIVLKQIKEKGLFFIDSKTTPESKSDRMARKIGVRAGARDVFLDNQQEEEYIKGQIEELKRIARVTGSAIGIGHPYPATIEILKKTIPEIEKEFEMVPASVLAK